MFIFTSIGYVFHKTRVFYQMCFYIMLKIMGTLLDFCYYFNSSAKKF